MASPVDFVEAHLKIDRLLIASLMRIARADANRLFMDRTAISLRQKVLQILGRPLNPIEEKELVRRLGEFACDLIDETYR